MYPFPTTESTLLFSGPIGDIEVLAMPAESQQPRAATAIICHPHPLHGGTMTNKVVTTLAKVFQNLGLRTVRFNFRGVGESAGTFDEGRGETEDLLALVNWIRELFPNDELWLAGFSFGAFVALNATPRAQPARLITVAPPVKYFDFQHAPEINCPWWVVQGEQDEVVAAQDVYAWIDTLEQKPKLIRMAEAGHFFHGKLVELRSELEEALKK